MKKNFTNNFILNTLGLPKIEDISDFSNKIGLSPTLIYLLAKKDYDKKYKKFFIAKRDGLQREILAPVYSLKLLQRWILENILYKLRISESAFAFRKGIGSGIKKNAEVHKDSLYILEMDLKDFFTSIKKERVFYFYRGIGYNEYISNILTDICTFNGYLPQGAVTSPCLSNLICYKMDIRIKKLCAARDIIYTRYADDLTFSCDNKNNLKKIYKIIERIIGEEKFVINQSKTRFLSPISQKRVTGVTINDGVVKAPKEMKKKVRAMIHRAIVSQDYSKSNIITGYISYINSIEDGFKEKIIRYINSFQEKDVSLFQEIIDSFNGNKFYSDCINWERMSIEDEELLLVEDEYLESIYSDRQDFLERIRADN